MTKKLYELAIDETFEMFLLIKNADVRTAKNGKPFIAFTFQDKSGQMDGKYWSATPEEIERYQSGRIVFLAGKREIYNGNAQVKISGMRLARDGEPNEPGLFMEQAPLTKEEMVDEINQTLFEITSAPMNRVVRFILNKFSQEVFEYPAAKRHHHAFTGGLGFHTVSMLRIAKSLANQYEVLNKPLLYSGVILHDLGKTMELTGAVGTEYTLKGNLLGHIVMMEEEISKACIELQIDEDCEEIIALKHVVLAHHGKLEYGSPVRPHLLEAEILHQIDLMDASINMITQALQKTTPGEFSERIFGMDNRSFYKPTFTE
ncbi:3'-5' exoribonuclease [Granulicatella balaenopterae]|uniref:3'-5' exoribonuclease n=1 Tax=Granulicatella balaenopterae TaxID=137733 RepID=A0A1H9JTU5_9LACT|nr:HD domain-containing protein [Granulicatella balaenopterae]SEQ90203.1 3'-5' exoribonuclease [Granulicatella balaenopterae]